MDFESCSFVENAQAFAFREGGVLGEQLLQSYMYTYALNSS